MYSSEHNKPIFYEDYGKQNGNKEKNTHRSKRAKFQSCKMKIKQHHKLGSIIEDAAFFEQLARNPGLGTAGPQVADLRGTAEDKEAGGRGTSLGQEVRSHAQQTTDYLQMKASFWQECAKMIPARNGR